MQTKLAQITLTLSILVLFLGQILILEKDRTFYKTTLSEKNKVLQTGLLENWDDHLLAKMQEGFITDFYSLKWNRKKFKLVKDFFPKFRSSSNWSKYQSYVQAKDQINAQNFLKTQFGQRDSWDRTLAIYEWWLQYDKSPELELTPFEETIVSLEADKAYSLIFSQFFSNKSFTTATSKWRKEQIFIRLINDDEIEAAVPSSKFISKKILPSFLKKNRVVGDLIANSPWKISFSKNFINIDNVERSKNSLEVIFYLISAFLFLVGVLLYYNALKIHKKAMLKKVTFLNQIVHELKTPMTTLKIHFQLLHLNFKKNEENFNSLEKDWKNIEKSLGACSRGISRINTLFDEISLMNRPVQKAEIDRIEISYLMTLFEDIKSLHTSQEMKIHCKISKPIYAEKIRLKIILNNLVNNGIKYGKKVFIDIYEDDAYTFIEIKDTGPGIKFQDKDKIFLQFYRSQGAQSISSDGLGLGLYICKKLSKEIAATLTLKNPGEKNACFQLKLNNRIQ